LRTSYEEYSPAHWGACLYGRHQKKSRMTPEEAVQRAMWLRAEMLGRFSLAVITIHGLDNPYMSEHARLTMLADARRTARMKRGSHDLAVGDTEAV
jgi:hypothetical protein